MLWLPLQGAIAAIMPLCAQAKQIGVSLDIQAVTAACDLHHDEAGQSEASQSAGQSAPQLHKDGAPDNMMSSLPCESLPCYAGFTTLLPSAYPALIFTGGYSYAVSFNSRFTSFILEQPQRPPLA